MSDPAIYQAYSFRPVKVTDANSQRTVEGKVRWRISPELPVFSYMEAWDYKGYKTGLNILNDQDVLSFEYDAEYGPPIVMVRAPGEVGSLKKALGEQDGYHWLAFADPGAGRPRAYDLVPDHDHTVEFTVRLLLKTPHSYRELIGAASRHQGADFTKGSTSSLWVVPVAPYTAP